MKVYITTSLKNLITIDNHMYKFNVILTNMHAR